MRIRLVLPLLLALPIFSAAHAEDFEIKNRDVAALVAALQKSNETPGPHRIRLAAGGIYTLESASSTGLGLPALRGEIVIEGNGAEIRRYAASRMALIEVAAEARVVIRDLTLAEGSRGRFEITARCCWIGCRSSTPSTRTPMPSSPISAI